MDSERIAIAETCLHAAHDGSLSFSEIVGKLIAAGFEGYSVDYRRNSQTYYLPDGDSVAMATEPLDLEAIVAQAAPGDAGIVPGTTIGHVHLHVADLARAEQFYGGALGLDVMQRSYPGALFMAAGGYHHHLGLNTWAGRTPPPANAVGLENYTIVIPGEAAWKEAAERTGAAVDGSTATVRDPDGTTVILEQG